MKKQYTIVLAIIVVALVLAGAGYLHQRQVAQNIADSGSINTLVAQFGQQMQKVSLSAPDAPAEIADIYAPYVTAGLIKEWQANKSFAPGRGLSSPWPSGIQIGTTIKNSNGTYTVSGTVIEITSQEVAHGGIAAEFPVTLAVSKVNGNWFISGYQAGPEQVFSNSTTTAASAGSHATTTSR